MSYPDYRTYLRFKNCCRPIGDTGPTGPAGTLDVPGNKGEILYFSEDNILDSTKTIFITTGNVSINNNLVVTGNLSMDDNFINDVSGIYFSDGTYIGHGSSFDITTSETLDISAAGGISITGNLTVDNATTVNKTLDVIGNTTLENLFVNGSINNIIEISGNTIQPIISDSVNLGYDESGSSNDKRFNLGFFNKIKSRTAVIVGNLTMEDSSITNVDNISSENNLTIQASDGVIIRGNLTVDDATTFKSDTTINANLTINAATTIRSNLSMNDNFINDVSGIYFSDGTYIGHGSSFDITTSQTLDISAAGGINLNTDVTINSNLTANTINTERLLFTDGNYIDYHEGVGELYVNGNTTLAHRVQLLSTLDVSGATTIRSNLSMNDNFINDVSGIYFTKGNLLFSDFSSVIQSVQLPSSQGQPISLERKTLFYQPSYNLNILNGNTIIDFSDSTIFNQLKLNVNGNVISPTPDISQQYVEIYANFDVSSNTSPSKTFSLDISSVSGASFLETIDVRSISKQGRFYLTFGPHIFTPEQWENTTGFNFIINNTGSNSFFINKYKLMFKSYFM